MHKIKRIAITGGVGHIAYSILFRLCAGDLFGKDVPIALNILEVESMVAPLKGVLMELKDCAFPLLHEVKIGSDPYTLFEGVEYAFLIGAKPRGPGMERKDLLVENGKIFIEQGQALDRVASEDVTVLVVGNPCNSNCLIAQRYAKRVNPDRFFAMTRLDQNRAVALLAEKSGRPVSAVNQMIIWGNHSATQVPDYWNAQIDGQQVIQVIQDAEWLENRFMKEVQERGAAIIAARGKSSAASAAHAAIESMRSIAYQTKEGELYSVGRLSNGNPYGVEEGLIFSFPCRTNVSGKVEIVAGIPINPVLHKKIKLSEKELIEERDQLG